MVKKKIKNIKIDYNNLKGYDIKNLRFEYSFLNGYLSYLKYENPIYKEILNKFYGIETEIKRRNNKVKGGLNIKWL